VTGSANFPLSPNAADKVCCAARDNGDGFIAKIIAGQRQELADLSITKEAIGNFRVGGKATYTITVSNAGPGVALPPLRVIDPLPAELTFDSFAGADWNCSADGQIVTCLSTKALAANASSTFKLTANVVAVPKPSQEGQTPPLVNTASVSALNGDAINGNNAVSSAGNIVDPPCSFAVAPSSLSFGAVGGTDNVAVTTQTGCVWNAAVTSGAEFISIEAISSGSSGSGGVNLRVVANTGLNDRSGLLVIAGQNVVVEQRGAACTYTVTPESQAFTEAGGTGEVTITTAAGCTWQVASDATSFVTLTSVSSGSGNGSVRFNVAANSGAAQRAGTLTVLGRNFLRTVNILQGSKTEVVCAFAVRPGSQSFSAKGGDRAFFVEVSPDSCEWTATTVSDFIAITSDRDQSGSAFITYLVPPNTRDTARQGGISIAQRVGAVTIPRQTFTISQDSQSPPLVVGCKYTLTIAPSNQTFDFSGGDGTVLVNAGSGCTWTAALTTGANFVTIDSGANGTGSGAVKFKIGQNTSNLARSGVLTIAGQTVIIRQTGVQSGTTCVLTIDPANTAFAAKGGDSAFFVNSSLDTCEWKATSSAGFLRVTSDRDQSGSAFITFVLEPNTGNAARSGTISIALPDGTVQQTFTVTQSGRVLGARASDGKSVPTDQPPVARKPISRLPRLRRQ
jgi:uncharacterized repeat protein (TIGR01451 family)